MDLIFWRAISCGYAVSAAVEGGLMPGQVGANRERAPG